MARTSIWTHREPNREAFLAWARKWHVSSLSEPEMDEQQPQKHLRYYHATTDDGIQYRISERLDGSWGFVSQDTSQASWNRMGRPSEGRSTRLQATITPEQMAWLEEKRIQDGERSVSDVVFKLLETVRK